MVNAVRLAGLFLDRLPRLGLSPETTDDREGFLHPYSIEGGVAQVTIASCCATSTRAKLAERAELLRTVARDGHGGVSAGDDRRESHAAVSQHGGWLEKGAARSAIC